MRTFGFLQNSHTIGYNIKVNGQWRVYYKSIMVFNVFYNPKSEHHSFPDKLLVVLYLWLTNSRWKSSHSVGDTERKEDNRHSVNPANGSPMCN